MVSRTRDHREVDDQNSQSRTADLTPALSRIVDLFAGAPKELRLQALLEYSKRLPALPAHYLEHREELESVPECQTAFFLAAEVAPDGEVRLHFDCPPEAPTTRGFAGILHAGLDGSTVSEVLAVPNDFYMKMGLAEVVSTQRMRGMSAILGRLKRQVAEKSTA